MKLFTRYSRINLLMMVGVFLLSGFAFYILVNFILTREMDADLGGIEEQFRHYAASHNSFPEGHPLDEEQINYIPTTSLHEPDQYRLVRRYSPREKKMHNFRELTFTLALDSTAYRVTIAKPLEGLHHLTRFIVIVSLSTILLVIFVSLLLNRIVLRRLWQPFYDAMHIMRNFKLGRSKGLEFPPTSIEEFTFMNESLGLAAEKAEQDYLLLKEFTENASHELQTPLSIIRSKLDLLIQEEELSQRQSEIVLSAYAAIKKLSRLNQSLLLLTKIGNQQFNHIESVDLKEKIEDKLRQFQELWQHNQVTARATLDLSSVKASPELIDILLNNLFSNASNHNIPGGRIGIQLQAQQLTISNTGLAAPLDPQRVFRRFYKGEQHTGHNGLGLSIIKQICEVSSITPAYLYDQGEHQFIFTW